MPFRIRKHTDAAREFRKDIPRQSVLARFGLTRSDMSAQGLAAFEMLAAERDALVEKLEAAEATADQDALTPARNRRAFMRELHRTMSEVERYRTPAAVLYLDLDGFKAINDAYGHGAGDAVLRQVARLLIDQVRSSDVVGRLGGDEFGIILNRAQPGEARAKAAAIVQAMAAATLRHLDQTHRVKASVGVHVIAAVEDPEIALARADEAMYADKHARRETAKRFPIF